MSVSLDQIRKLAVITLGSACFLLLKTMQVWLTEQFTPIPAWCNYCIATVTLTLVGWVYHSIVSFKQPLQLVQLYRYIVQAIAITIFDFSLYNLLVYVFEVNTVVAVPATSIVVFMMRVLAFVKYVFVPKNAPTFDQPLKTTT